MAAKKRRYNPVPVGELVSGIVDPVIARRSGITISLLQAWDEIVGDNLGSRSRPERIRWAARRGDDDPFEPATLVIACDGPAALHIQHQTSEIIARINAFVGFAAVGRVKIVQKPVGPRRSPRATRQKVDPRRLEEIQTTVAGVDDEELRQALARLGVNIAGNSQ